VRNSSPLEQISKLFDARADYVQGLPETGKGAVPASTKANIIARYQLESVDAARISVYQSLYYQPPKPSIFMTPDYFQIRRPISYSV
jgi:hypothetical protein